MKSYNHLWEKFISKENIEKSIKDASKGKRSRNSVKTRLNNPNLTEEILAYANDFRNKKHKPKEIYDGIQRKKRVIIVPDFDEQVIHHMVVNILKPIFMKGMYFHSYGSIPKRGGHKGKKSIEKFIKNHPKSCKYCLKMDIRKYFDSIPHDVVIRKLEKIIHDEKFMRILREIINVVPNGLPLGFYTSQWIANWYLQGLDHYIKENLRAEFYIRYMDDMVIFGSNKKKLHKIRKSISGFLEDLGLEMKQNWQVYKFDYNGKYRFLDFMGFRFYRNRTTLRRTIMLKMTRKARRIWKSNKITIYATRQMLSYLGWIKVANVYGMYENFIKPIVNFEILKRKIRNHDKNARRRDMDGVVPRRINDYSAG